VTVVKNKIAPPFRKVEFDIMFDRGISYEGDLLDLGVLHGVVLKSGTWLSFKHPKEGEIRLGQGREKARALLIDNPEVAKEIDLQIRAKLAPAKEGAPPAVAAAGNGAMDEIKPASPAPPGSLQGGRPTPKAGAAGGR
jgi:recombination protein RecA